MDEKDTNRILQKDKKKKSNLRNRKMYYHLNALELASNGHMKIFTL